MTIRSVVRPYVYNSASKLGNWIGVALTICVVLPGVILLSPLIAMIAFKAWFDERPVLDTVLNFLTSQRVLL